MSLWAAATVAANFTTSRPNSIADTLCVVIPCKLGLPRTNYISPRAYFVPRAFSRLREYTLRHNDVIPITVRTAVLHSSTRRHACIFCKTAYGWDSATILVRPIIFFSTGWSRISLCKLPHIFHLKLWESNIQIENRPRGTHIGSRLFENNVCIVARFALYWW